LKFLLDTNIVLYFLGGRIEGDLPEGEYFVSVITEIELLSYSPLDAASEAQIREFLKTVAIAEIRQDVVGQSIVLRRRYGLKLPDTIIAATALSIGAELITNDQKFIKVTELPSRQI